MNRTKIKNYAPQARRDFLQAVTDRAAFYGLTADRIEPVTAQGDVAIIGGRAFPREVGARRKALQERVERDGYGPTMEGLAYTWFNRLVAIRYMELHGYLDHGYRVLSSATDGTRKNTDQKDNPISSRPCSVRVPSVADIPEILLHAEHVELPDLNRERVVELKLDGSKEAELYRMLLVAQCNALHSAMPFLFERIGDETELVLPESLLHSDSIVRKLVSGIDEEDWQEVEVIGWLYEAYVSERYEAVIGSVVASADIPAATQRFTPKWIVRYLVQNTLGRLWMEHHPDSPLKAKMKYYIEPAEQTTEVQAQLKELIQKRATELHGRNTDQTIHSNSSNPCSIRVPSVADLSLNPESLTFLDPACGSAHILVEAYDLFKAIYQERGYRAKDIPRLILTKNLFGLEIDDRAAQLAAFALMMKARADDRRIFEQGIQPQVRALIQTDGMDVEDMAAALNVSASKEASPPGLLFETEDNLFTQVVTTATTSPSVATSDVKTLIDLFEHAKTFGSLIQVPPSLTIRLPQIELRCLEVAGQTDKIESRTAAKFLPVVQQARLLTRRYDCVVANPPYMTSDNYNKNLKKYIGNNYSDAKADLCTCFVERALKLATDIGYVSEVIMQNWMFIARFDAFRVALLKNHTLSSLVQLGPNAFPNIGGKVVQVAAFVLRPFALNESRGTYIRLLDGNSQEKEENFKSVDRFIKSAQFFRSMPASPVLYWITDRVRECLIQGVPLGEFAEPRCGMNTGENARFIRQWHEVQHEAIGLLMDNRQAAFESKCRWVPYNKGGKYRRWFGNCDSVIRFDEEYYNILANLGNKLPSREFYFRKSITWSKIGDTAFAVRCSDKGFLFDGGGSSAFPPDEWHSTVAGFLCSVVAHGIIKSLNPTVNFQSGDVAALPVLKTPLLERRENIERCVSAAVQLARLDWDLRETSWNFYTLPVFQHKSYTLQESQAAADAECLARFSHMRTLEEENNRTFIDAYGLQDEIFPEVSDDQITLYRPSREEDIKRLISYSVGCMMGRYSLDTPGLIYAHGGNVGFDPGQYKTFPADPDGIVPVMEADWFADDATNRFVEFLGVVWPKEQSATESHGQNTEKASKELSSSVFRPCDSVANDLDLKFVADALGPSRGEQPRDTIRRYLATGFFKHHLQTYKRRPIYWLFSSGKQRAFQCLVYLHRYHEGTLARMRTEYVIPLQGKLAARIDQVAGDVLKKDLSTSHRNTLTKERDKLVKQQAELQAYDETLRHFADKRITLDLDDGVKVNYGKFGDLLAEVKAVTGGKEDD